MTRLAVLTILLCTLQLFAQPPEVEWTRTFDVAGFVDVPYMPCQTYDNGCVIPETHQSDDSYFCSLRKLDSSGTSLWYSEIHSRINIDIYQVRENHDRNLVVVGTMWAVPDTFARTVLMEFDEFGDSLRTFEFSSDTAHFTMYALDVCADGGYLLGGEVSSPGNFAPTFGRVVKTTSDGEVVWETSIGGVRYTPIYDIIETPDGGCFASLVTNDIPEEYDVGAVKIDAGGNIEWGYSFDNPSLTDEGWAVGLTAYGGYLVGGAVYHEATGRDFFVARLDSAGHELWTRTLDHNLPLQLPNWETVHMIEELPDGDIVMVGSVEPLVYVEISLLIARLDPAGNVRWHDVYAQNYWNYGCLLTDDLHVIGTGWSSTAPSRSFVFKTAALSVTDPAENDRFIAEDFDVQVYPNPFNSAARVSFDIPSSSPVKVLAYDLLGRQARVLADRQFAAGKHVLTFDGTGLAGGTYFIRVEAGQESKVVKTMLLK